MSDTRPIEMPPSPTRRAACVTLAGLLAGWALWISATTCVSALRAASDREPPLAELMVQRLEPAMELLLDTRSVRYVQREENYDPTTAKARRVIAGYALVPVLVTDDPNEQLILADFADDPSLAVYMQANPVTLIAHLGPGLGLLEVNRP